MKKISSLRKIIPLEKRLIVALDLDSPDEAKQIVSDLQGLVSFYKIGWQLFTSSWFTVVDWIIDQGMEVMLDLKLLDIVNTTQAAVKTVSKHKVRFLTVHSSEQNVKAAVNNKNSTQILAITVLTNLDDNDLRQMGYLCSADELVRVRTRIALANGCEGIVASGLEARKIRDEFGEDFYIATPGVRLSRTSDDDQKRIATVKEAIVNGADYVILGRPVLNADDRKAKVEEILRDIEMGLTK